MYLLLGSSCETERSSSPSRNDGVFVLLVVGVFGSYLHTVWRIGSLGVVDIKEILEPAWLLANLATVPYGT